jgi:hypothetical protein
MVLSSKRNAPSGVTMHIFDVRACFVRNGHLFDRGLLRLHCAMQVLLVFMFTDGSKPLAQKKFSRDEITIVMTAQSGEQGSVPGHVHQQESDSDLSCTVVPTKDKILTH